MGLLGYLLEFRWCSLRESCISDKSDHFIDADMQSYIYSVLYMATHDPENYRFSTFTNVALFATLLTAYYVWDTSMSQKSRFKMQTQGITTFRNTFPQLPGGTLKDPKFIQTAHGYAIPPFHFYMSV